MQPFVFEATFENGVLKPDRALPLVEHQRIKVSVGDAETVERIALDPEFGVRESP